MWKIQNNFVCVCGGGGGGGDVGGEMVLRENKKMESDML